jgi:RNA polymerase sigma factor (sigma-70 family)
MRDWPDDCQSRVLRIRAVQAIAGDNEAFGQFVRRHQSAVYRFLARRSGVSDAEDLLAEVWANAFRSRDSFDAGRGSALPWLYGIGRNVLREHWRKPRHNSRTNSETIDPWLEVDNRLSATAATRALRVPLMSLPEGQREVLLLIAWEGLTPSEAADAMGIPPSTARSNLRRARLALRDQAALLHKPDA